jgi:hypothetical protein
MADGGAEGEGEAGGEEEGAGFHGDEGWIMREGSD